MPALSIHRECQCTRFSREQESEKVEGIVHTLCAVLKHVRNYLIFHKVKDLSPDSIYVQTNILCGKKASYDVEEIPL